MRVRKIVKDITIKLVVYMNRTHNEARNRTMMISGNSWQS